CSGRKNCSICAAKACSGGSGYPGYGSGYPGYSSGYPGYASTCRNGYGATSNYGYGYPSSSAYGYYYCYGTTVRPKRESSGSSDATTVELEKGKVKELEDALTELRRELTTLRNVSWVDRPSRAGATADTEGSRIRQLEGELSEVKTQLTARKS